MKTLSTPPRGNASGQGVQRSNAIDLNSDCVTIDGSRCKEVKDRDRNFTRGKIASRSASG